MANIHTPQRMEGESFAAYKARRAESNRVARDLQRNPNHGLVSSRQRLRDSTREAGDMGKRIRASDALMEAWAQKRIAKWEGKRDEHGAYVAVGPVYEMQAAEGECINPSSREHVLGGAFGNGGHTDYTARRKWLAGISAQRGY